MDFVMALIGGISGGLTAGFVLRHQITRTPSETTDPFVLDDGTRSDIESTVLSFTDDPIKQQLLARKLTLGMTTLGHRRGRRTRQRGRR